MNKPFRSISDAVQFVRACLVGEIFGNDTKMISVTQNPMTPAERMSPKVGKPIIYVRVYSNAVSYKEIMDYLDSLNILLHGTPISYVLTMETLTYAHSEYWTKQ